MTTTVRRRALTVSFDTMTHGLVFRISDPRVGSSWTHQTSPRRGSATSRPRLDLGVRQRVEFVFDFAYLRIRIGRVARFDEATIPGGESFGKRFCDVT